MADFESKLPVRLYGYESVGDSYDAIYVDTSGSMHVRIITDDLRYTDGTAVASQVGIPAMGTDGTNLQFLSTNATGHLNIADGGNSITVDGTVAVSSISGTVTVDSEINTFDWDTGAGTDTDAGIGIYFAADGGKALVSSSNPLPVAASITINAEKVDDSAFTIGTDYVSVAGYLADETAPDSVDEGDVGAARMTLDRKQLMVLVDATNDANRLAIDSNGLVTTYIGDGTNTAGILNGTNDALYVALTDGTNTVAIDGSGYLTVNVNGTVTVTATALDIRQLTHTGGSPDSVQIGDGTETWSIDTNGYGQVDIAAQSVGSIAVSKDNNANSETNPIFVQMAAGTSGQEAHDYDTAAAVAKNGTDNHDYTVTGTTFLLKRIFASGSGAMKIEVQTGPVASLATVAVGFNSTANPNIEIVFDPPLEVPATSTGTVRIIRTNRDNQSQDLYSTIMGSEVA